MTTAKDFIAGVNPAPPEGIVPRVYTRAEQMNALIHIRLNFPDVSIRGLARAVHTLANNPESAIMPALAVTNDAKALAGVPWATIYNRLRKIGGDLMTKEVKTTVAYGAGPAYINKAMA